MPPQDANPTPSFGGFGLRDRAFDLAFTDESVTVTRGNPSAVLDDEAETHSERIYQALLRRAMSTNELAEHLEIPPLLSGQYSTTT